MRIDVLIYLILLFAQSGIAQIKIGESPNASKPIHTVQWEVYDLVYRVKQKIENPFNANVFAIVKAEEGTQKIPLFYNGNKEWI